MLSDGPSSRLAQGHTQVPASFAPAEARGARSMGHPMILSVVPAGASRPMRAATNARSRGPDARPGIDTSGRHDLPRVPVDARQVDGVIPRLAGVLPIRSRR
jgi:hypothetical protein